MRTLQERLKLVMAGPPKVTQAALARACGIRAPSVNDWISGKTKTIEGQNLLIAADYLKVMPMWLATGKGPMRKGVDGGAQPASKESNVVLIESRRKSQDSSFITIPQLDVAGSMGPGRVPPDHIEVIRDITVHLDWLKTQGLSYSKLENLAIIDGDGDSMEGTFRNGDALLVDRGITEIRTDAIYVFTLEGELFIKRLQRLTGGSLRMISDNPVYPAIMIEGDMLAKVHIQARVLLVWNARKL
ncbi:S24 family peptidase [Pseudomonas proteolytica]|uniref:Phage repressor protein n=1 Tax=Pseudomonas proteolytica TaxID=219574 RepID=A0AAW5AG95_9PSED|nr:S24 family peptidase [Pseudomonas proteolytica]KAA8698824.1 helix-turn-helix transcriptional regulator [Pseudomonas proteolytica]MCF5059101.1 phage repressor protein [Pseudomonas proteolytica]MCF5103320.1 phage repressor protein [Pseudomonas proteolytica]TWR75631.1 helix-turn-helix transcriptional regulator [Pseudomonas proteolytica]SEE22297.1 Phage repressor protein C, contains Cro/C1-type HTH and peptisase s24 domains [Pseudomonas proteolytica]